MGRYARRITQASCNLALSEFGGSNPSLPTYENANFVNCFSIYLPDKESAFD